MIRANTHNNGIVIDIITIGKLKDGKLAGEKRMKNTLIKIDLKKFVYDRIWFGWMYVGPYTGWIHAGNYRGNVNDD